MSAAEATAEVFATAFKSLKRRQREAILERIVADEELSQDLADTLALESRRHQPRQSFRHVRIERTENPSLSHIYAFKKGHA